MKSQSADRMEKVPIYGMSQLHYYVPHSEWITDNSEVIGQFSVGRQTGYDRMDVGSNEFRWNRLQPMLIIFGGLPGTGKTTIAWELARQLGAAYLRIDSIEQAIWDAGMVSQLLNDAGYRAGYAVAEDNLRLGRTVIADSVNPIQLTRDAWVGVAGRAQVRAIEVEVTCSDPEQHQLRVEKRASEIGGLTLPTLQEVVSREYEPWDRPHISKEIHFFGLDGAFQSASVNARRAKSLNWNKCARCSR